MRLRSSDGPVVMDYEACEAGVELDGMSGAGGDEWEATLIVSWYKLFPEIE